MNTPDPEFVYLQLAQRLADAIGTGAFTPGERLPSVRMLAQRERVSIATALATYRHLENRRLVEARPKSGYFVRVRPPRLAEPEAPAAKRAPAFVGVNRLVMEILDASQDPKVVALGAACPSSTLFPTSKLQRMLGARARRRPEALGEYGMATGAESLRHQIAQRAFGYGCRIEPEEVIVTNGCMEALNIALHAVAAPGSVVALESPTYFGVLQIVESLGMKALEIPTSPRTGLSLDALDLATRRPGAVSALLVMPNFSNPLGCLMPDANKKRMVEMMAERGIPVIEDDIYGDLHFGDRRPKPAKAWDRTGNVLLASSFTKTVAPGLRVGWIAPGRWFAQVSMLKFISTISTAELGQEVIAEFMGNGGYDHHLRRLRRAFREQVGRMTDAIERHFPAETRVTRPAGGFVLWVELPPSVDALALFQAASAKGVSLGPGVIFSPTGRYTHHLRLNCGLPWSDRLETAMRDVGQAARRLAGRPPP